MTRFVDQLDGMTPHGVPSLIHCIRLKVKGKIRFAAGVVLKGEVEIVNEGDVAREVPSGIYADQVINLSLHPDL